MTHVSQMLRPFARLLATHPRVPAKFADELATLVDAGRVPVSRTLQLVAEATALTEDPDLGLHAAQHLEIGDFQALEWVASSASTWREATETVCRYVRVLNETADYRLEVHGDKQHLVLGSRVPLGRQMADFQVAAYYQAVRMRDPEPPPEQEIWIAHPRPQDASAYRELFPTSLLVFDAAFYGFVSNAHRLDHPFPTANASLHGVLRDHADNLLKHLAPGDDVIDRVCADIFKRLGSERVTVERTAARLGMNRRTLSRHLATHGTSFSDLLQQVRYRTAIHYLRYTDRSVEEIAFLLSYSECPPFVRAFKRWSGLTPHDYRVRGPSSEEDGSANT